MPGRFEWEPGLLTRALQQGAWLLIEDIDSAQQDVLALLASLLQSGPAHIPLSGTYLHRFLRKRTIRQFILFVNQNKKWWLHVKGIGGERKVADGNEFRGGMG